MLSSANSLSDFTTSSPYGSLFRKEDFDPYFLFHGTRQGNQNLKFIFRLHSRTHFTEQEIISLLSMYHFMIWDGPLNLSKFREVLHACFDIYDEMMLDRMFRSFDKDNSGQISCVEWVEGLSILLRGTPQEQVAYTYFIYDVDGDGKLVRDELQGYLRKCVYQVPNVIAEDDVEDGERDIIDTAMLKLDSNKDGLITFQDFERCCFNEPLLVEALGDCIPSPKVCAAFLATFTENYRYFSSCPAGAWSKAQWDERHLADYNIGPSARTPLIMQNMFAQGPSQSPPESPPQRKFNSVTVNRFSKSKANDEPSFCDLNSRKSKRGVNFTKSAVAVGAKDRKVHFPHDAKAKEVKLKRNKSTFTNTQVVKLIAVSKFKMNIAK